MTRTLEIIGSKDLNLKFRTFHPLAIRLLEGGVVECDGLCVKAVEALDPDDPCLECTMDSACSHLLMELCAEVDQTSGKAHCLSLVSSIK